MQAPSSKQRSRIPWIFAAGLLILAGSCREPAAPPAWEVLDWAAPDSRLHGVWENRERGHLLAVRAGEIEIWHRLGEQCVADTGVVPRFELFRLAANESLDLSPYDYRSRPELLEPAVTFQRVGEASIPCTVLGEDRPFSREETFDLVWRLFEQFYAGFDARGIDWQGLRAGLASRAASIESDEELFDLLSDLLRPLGDGHVNLSFGEDWFNAGRPELRSRLAEHWRRSESELAEGAFVADWDRSVGAAIDALIDEGTADSAAAGALQWGRIGGAGYLRVNRFGGFTEEPAPRAEQLAALEQGLSRMLKDLGDTEKMIVDVARNGGGSDAAAMAVAATFGDQTREVLQYRTRQGPAATLTLFPAAERYAGPVVLVTSEITASAAESFVLAMRTLPHVEHVGGATRGGLSGLLPKPLPNGFRVTISFQQIIDADGAAWEAAGIPPTRPLELFPDDDIYGGLAATIGALAREAG